MTNNDTMNATPRHYKLFRREDGSTGLIHDPLGNCLVVTDAVEVEELDVTEEQAQTLREQYREDALDFASAVQEFTPSVEPEQQPPHETMERNITL